MIFTLIKLKIEIASIKISLDKANITQTAHIWSYNVYIIFHWTGEDTFKKNYLELKNKNHKYL